MFDLIRSVTETITAMCAMGTLGFTVFVFLRVSVVAEKAQAIVVKTEEIHAASIDILKQTNGIMERSEAKTEVIAHAAGVQEGLAQHVATAASLAPAAATAAALLLETAANAAKEVAAKALVDAAAAAPGGKT